MNYVTIKEYFDHRINKLSEFVNHRFTEIEKSTNLANENLKIRLDSMNEFREALKDSNTNFITKSEHQLVLNQIAYLRETLAEAKGKASMSAVYISYIIAVIGIIISIIGLVHGFLVLV
jgi:hypothetical protein